VLKLAPDWFAETNKLDAKGRADARQDVRTATLALLAGTVGVVGAAYTARSFALNRAGQLTDRFTKAIEQLGHRELDVRLGGIYALERIARDSKEDHPQVVEVLTAYVREHAAKPQGGAAARESQRAAAENADVLQQMEVAGPATDVQAVLTVLGRRTLAHEPDAAQPLDLAGTALVGANLSGANVSGANLIEADLGNASLSNASLVGAHLTLANLNGADLIRADLTGADVVRADLSGAKLDWANLLSADLSGAKLARAKLSYAKLTRANLMRADLRGANLSGADIIGAYLNGAELVGAHLNGAELVGADLTLANLMSADLTLANLNGADLSTANHLNGADLSDARYDRGTSWPKGFDPRKAGARLLEGGQ
jgi:uncharacterized protein YjbI with pentapeptide repeats